MVDALHRPQVAADGLEAEALIEEARRRQRRRWRWIAALSVAALGLAVGLAFSTGGGSGGVSPPGSQAPSPGAPAGISYRSASAPTGTAGPGVMGAGSFGGGESGWAVNGQALFVTDDGGGTWYTATPPSLLDQVVGDRVNSVVGYGTTTLWVGAQDVIGLVPPPGASSRGTEVLRSTDGGKTWEPSYLPGCLQGCGGNPQLDFVSPAVGFAALGGVSSEPGYLFSTTDGGASWSLAGRAPTTHFSVVFTSRTEGWAVGNFNSLGVQATGAIYRTTDGGKTWTQARGLLITGKYQVADFFSADNGVVFGFSPRATVYTTTDGGASWHSHLVPVPVPSRKSELEPTPVFSAPTDRSWFLSWGRTLVETSDAGQHWTTIDEKAAWPKLSKAAKGGAWNLVFFSPTVGWALVGHDCSHPWGCSSQVIIGTHDGGLSWRYLDP